MAKRIAVAVPIIIILLLVLFLQNWFLLIFAVAVSLMAQYEITKAFADRLPGSLRSASILYAVCLAVFFAVSFVRPAAITIPFLQLVFTAFVFFIIAVFILAMFARKGSADALFDSILMLVYPQALLTLFYALILDKARFMCAFGDDAFIRTLIILLIVFVPAMFTDTAAYLFGRAFGKKKLCPAISPNKTVVGSVAGIAGGAIAGILIFAVFYSIRPEVVSPAAVYLIMGAVLAVISQFGDLAASFIKRSLNIKDFGKILPGHGGILDRVDSVLFCVPVVYLFSLMNLV